MFDLSLLDEAIPDNLKMASGRKPKVIDNRYSEFFKKYNDYQMPSYIDDLLWGAARASTPDNEFIAPQLIRRCFVNLPSFSVANVQSQFATEMSKTYLKNIVIACEGMQKRLDHHLPKLTEEQLKPGRPLHDF